MKKLEKLSSKLKDYINKRNFIYMITENTKALLAAGLIGTASLGMQSCAQPTDDYDTYIVNPDDTKKGDNTVVEEKYPVCKQLSISETDADLLKGKTFKYIDKGSLAANDLSLKGFLYKDNEGFDKNVKDLYTVDSDAYIAIVNINGTPVAYCIPEGTKAYNDELISKLNSELKAE